MTDPSKLSSYFDVVRERGVSGIINDQGHLSAAVDFPATKEYFEGQIGIVGRDRIQVGSKSEERDVFISINVKNPTPNSTYYIETGGREKNFSYSLEGEVVRLSVVELNNIKIEGGKFKNCPVKFGNLKLNKLEFAESEDGGVEMSGEIKGPLGMVYAFEIRPATESLEASDLWFDKVDQDDDRKRLYDYLSDVNLGDEVNILLGYAEPLGVKLSISKDGTAEMLDG